MLKETWVSLSEQPGALRRRRVKGETGAQNRAGWKKGLRSGDRRGRPGPKKGGEGCSKDARWSPGHGLDWKGPRSRTRFLLSLEAEAPRD